MAIKMKNIISITEARANIFDIAEKVQKVGNHYIFTEGGKPKLAVMSADEYDSLMEDLALASDPKWVAKMKSMDEDFAKGEFVPWEEVRKKLHVKHHDLVVAEKSKNKYSAQKKKNRK